MESKNPTIKRYKLGENLIPHDNPNTSLCCKNWKKCYEEKFELLTDSVKHLKGSIEELTATTVQQNNVIMEALATQNVLTEKLLGKEKFQKILENSFQFRMPKNYPNVTIKQTKQIMSHMTTP
ncbi:uncharacterized protein LOC124419778 [Lucilia cuprina]|uniref:uncharacterized protein LOC124419778 n=1 Tax=Lucilia cuprina TaxID=7375 RepID=UPI001F06BE71|nr:uncharacterized protein LOC124419778 [Lucilia cuprina]